MELEPDGVVAGDHGLGEPVVVAGAHPGEGVGEALGKVQGGDHDWFTKPMIASYHTVWFELHEDLLATLGIERSSESAS